MITTAIFILTLLVVVGMLIATRDKAIIKKDPTDRYDHDKINPKYIIKPAVVLILGLLIMFFQPYKFTKIDAGYVGIESHMTGDARGISAYEYKNGWITYNTWTRQLYEYPTFQQHIEYDTMDVITKGGFMAKIKPTFNYSLIPGAVGDMFQNLRKPISEIEQGWLKTAILGSVNDVANRWTVDDIFNQREQFEGAIINECNKRVIKWFTVSQLRSNIAPPSALQASIIAKTQAIQGVQVAENNTKVANAKRLEKMAIAQGDSAQAVITAAGVANATLIQAAADAKAMNLKQRELTPTYVDYIRAQNWNGQLPATMLGSGSNTLFNLK